MLTNLETEERDGVKYLLRPEGNHDRLIFRTNVESRVWARHMLLGEDQVWLDVGAHVGYFALGIAPYVKQVVCYEPDPSNLELMRAQIELNGFTNIEVVEECLGDKPGERTFWQNDALYSGSAREKPIRGRSSYQVSFRGVLQELARTGAKNLKLNCEGSEVEIIRAVDWSTIDQMEFEFHRNLLGDKRNEIYDSLLSIVDESFPHVAAWRGPTKAWLLHAYCSRWLIGDSGNMKKWMKGRADENLSHGSHNAGDGPSQA